MDSYSFYFADFLERVRAVLPASVEIYLVGGAVRDALLGRLTHDLDFVANGDVLRLSRVVANSLKGAFYPLDEARDTGRVILTEPGGERQVLDFAAFRGPDLESDLRARDFTINAIALTVQERQQLIDPLGGAADLRNGVLRACSETAFQDDPLRILRGVRLASAFDLRIQSETILQMRQSVSSLNRVSPERLRDELFRILSGPQPATSLRVLDILGALPFVLPELEATKGVTQSSPHVYDVWNHSLAALRRLGNVLDTLSLQADPDAASNLFMGEVSLLLGRYRQQIHEHLQALFNPDRSVRDLLSLATLLHDVGKPETRSVEASGRIRFFEHDRVGAQLATQRARKLHLSNEEVERLGAIIRYHLRPLLLAQTGRKPSPRAIYRFFRDAGPAGVDICMLSMADSLATYGTTMPPDEWNNHLRVVRSLLEAYWEHPTEHVSPPALVNGLDLMQEFNLKPGPQIGRLLEAIREAQAMGEVQNRQQALNLARKQLQDRHFAD